MTKRGFTYKDAGVDVDAANALVPVLRRLARKTLSPDVIEGIGGFGCAVRIRSSNARRAPVIVAGTDGVGTKLKIAFALGRHDTVGIDCVAMCVNDIICCGARPLFFLDYIGMGKLDPRVVSEVVKGVARGCAMAGISLVGGETAELPGIYGDGEYDLVGFAVGIASLDELPSPSSLREGDALVGLASSGLHSNGFSLARKVLLEHAKLRLESVVPELGCTLGEELLRPTRIYAGLITEIRRRFPIKAVAHITGGGIVDNLPRVLPQNLAARIKTGSWPVPPIFKLIATLGNVSQDEMNRTFNNGLGMIVVTAAEFADRVIAFLKRRKLPAYRIGMLERGKRRVIFD